MAKKDLKEKLISSYLKFIKKENRIPSFSDLNSIEITRASVRHHFGDSTTLHKYMRDAHPEDLSSVLDENSFTTERFKEIKKEAKNYDKFVITTAVCERAVDVKFLEALKSYCKKNKAMLMILPCQDVASRRREFNWNLDPLLKDEYVVFNDVKLNDKLFVSTIKVSAKQIDPIRGLTRITQKNGSLILAAPKQLLTYVANSNEKKIPRALMTTGAVTIGDYSTDKYMSARTSYIAEDDHMIGAVVVEIENRRTFHFRHLEASKDRSFVDAGVRYHPDGSTEKVEVVLVPGDIHDGATDPVVKEVTKEICKTLKVTDLIAHDFHDGRAVNHHDEGNPLKKAKKHINTTTSLKAEIQMNCKTLNEMLTWVSGNIVLVKSNHDEVLERYLNEARYANDHENHYYSLDLAKKYLEGQDPLKYAIEEVEGVNDKSRLRWLKRDEEYKIGDLELGAHGDKGPNGSRASLTSMESSFGSAIVAHSHTAAILRRIKRVGTSTLLDQGYNVGPSSWTHTHALVYPDGTSQLINIIGKKWRL